jgi:flagellar biosynthesis protein FliR
MTGTLAELLALTDAGLWHGYAVFLRLGAMVSLMPGFGETVVSMRVKLALALAFTIVVAPAVAPLPRPPAFADFLPLVVAEVLAGLILGLGLRLMIMALQTAGAIAAQSTSLSQILGGAVAEPTPAMGQVLVIGGLALAMMTGMHVKVAALAILSYDILPMGAFPGGEAVAAWGTGRIRAAFELAFMLAAPFVILSVLYNLALGAINKAMPQLMVAFVGAPVITAGGLILLCLAAPLMLQVWIEALDGHFAEPFAVTP